jgi:hypothetical protein
MAQQVHQLQVHQLVQVAVAHHNEEARAEHLERMRVKNRVAKPSHVKHFAMSSTICRHRNLVVQLFRTEMEKLQFACVVAHRWQTLPTRLAQIQQH